MISIVIPLFNKEKSIEKTILSVLRQTYSDFELIVVNDGSTDKSQKIIDNMVDKRIKIINQQNKGVSAARNIGIKKATCNIIALLDSDDIWSPHFLYEMDKLAKDYPEASLYGCACSYISNNILLGIPNYGVETNFRGYLENYFSIAIHNTLFNSSSVLLRKQDFLELGGFDEQLSKGEDIDLWIKFALNKKLAYVNKPLSFYMLDADNRATNKKTEKSKNLIWNLGKYSYWEKKEPEFKKFIDGWRLAHIANYLNGVRYDVDNIRPILKEIDLKEYSFFYRILYFSPSGLHKLFYKTWKIFKKIKWVFKEKRKYQF